MMHERKNLLWRRLAFPVLPLGGMLLILGVAVWLMVAQPQAVAQSATFNLETRISRLELDLTQLRYQINQVQSQIGQQRSNVTRSPSRPSTRPGESALAEDPTFRRLATLVIELRDRIDTLENQVTALQRNAAQ